MPQFFQTLLRKIQGDARIFWAVVVFVVVGITAIFLPDLAGGMLNIAATILIMLPTAIALCRWHNKLLSVFILNLIGGATVLGAGFDMAASSEGIGLFLVHALTMCLGLGLWGFALIQSRSEFERLVSCLGCGKRISPLAAACPKCGHPQAPESIPCVQCGRRLSPLAATCPGCGHPQAQKTTQGRDSSPNGN